MANSIKNLPEIIEKEKNYENTLRNRKKQIKNFSILGPPDLCYLTKVFHKTLNISFAKPIYSGFFHYNYGLCPSTPGAVSAYVTSLLKLQEEEENWFSSGKWTISKAFYCMYDSFSKIDIHVEITIPGGMKLFGINSNEELINIDEEIWEKAYFSSIMRAMIQERAPCTKIFPEFRTLEDMDVFLDNLLEFIIKNNIAMDNKDLITHKGNLVLNIVCNYLIQKRRYHHAIDFFKKVVGINFKYIVFLSEIFNSLGNHLDTIKLIAPILQKNPHITTLIYQEAVSIMEIKRFDLAGRLTKYLLQISPECFEVWLLYLEILIRCKNYKAVLLTFSVLSIPTLKDPENALVTEGNYDYITNPKEKGNSDYFNFNFDSEQIDFKANKLNEDYKFIQQEYLNENKRMEDYLLGLPATKFNKSERKVYDILVRIELEIGWDKLLILRNSLFDNDDGQSFAFIKNKKNESPANPEYCKDNKNQRFDEEYEVYEINPEDKNKIESSAEEKIAESNPKVSIPNIHIEPTYDENDYSETEHELPSFLLPEHNIDSKDVNSVSSPIKSSLQGIKQEHIGSKGMTTNKEEETFKDHQLSIRKIEAEKNYDPHTFEAETTSSKKRAPCLLLDSFLSALFIDLTSIMEWTQDIEANNQKKKVGLYNDSKDEDEDDDDENIEDLKLSGKVWLIRGMLARRLKRIRLSENAFRKCCERGTSLFAWKQLLKIYLEIENFKASLVCIAEILDLMQNEGVENFTVMPRWIEAIILEIISRRGYKEFTNILHELSLEDDIIEEVVKDAVYWKVQDGGA